MPTKPSRDRRWIKEGKATPFWKHGVFCVRLNIEPSDREFQPIAVGIDPGSKKEGFTVKSEAHTYLNIQADAVTWVKDAVEVCRTMRRARRFRKIPCRKNRYNRARTPFPPYTKARWQWKLRLCRWLAKLFSIECFVVEDIKAHTRGGGRWNKSFSPLQVDKQWFYCELRKIAQVETQQGYETKELRDGLGLKKTKRKMAEVFEAHCVDSWVLANGTGGPVDIHSRITGNCYVLSHYVSIAVSCIDCNVQKAGFVSPTAVRLATDLSAGASLSIRSGDWLTWGGI